MFPGIIRGCAGPTVPGRHVPTVSHPNLDCTDARPSAAATPAATILPIGRAQAVDAAGCIVNPCAPELIPPSWQAAVRELLEICRQALGPALHSLYLRGSVPRGLAIDGVSDLDAIGLVQGPQASAEDWIRPMDARVRAMHPGCRGVELRLWPLQGLDRLPPQHPARFLLKTQALCLWGPDVAAAWAPVPLEDARIVLNALPRALARMRVALHTAQRPDHELMRERCRWLAKKIVRAGFELVAVEEQAYTRDLHPCWLALARHHPRQAGPMRDVLELALEPTADASRIASVIALGEWVLAQAMHCGRLPAPAGKPHPGSSTAVHW